MAGWTVALICAFAAWAQESPAAKTPARTTAETKKSEKDEAKNPTQEFLKSTVDLIPSATPGVQVTALTDAAELYGKEHKKEALALLQQAFQTAGGIPARPGREAGSTQAMVLVSMAGYDPSAAAELLGGLSPKARAFPLFAVVSQLIEEKQLEKAIATLELHAMPEAYPYAAANMVLNQLAEDDPRRAQIFGAAASSFNSEADIQGFSQLLQSQWRKTPRVVVDPAVHRAVSTVLKMKRPDPMSVSKRTEKGAVTFDNETDADLFELMGAMQGVDPKGAREILDSRPTLKAALERFPDGSSSMSGGGQGGMTMMQTRSGDSTPSANVQEEMRLNAISDQIAAEALKLAADNALEAVKKAKEIPLEKVKASTLIQIAQAAAAKDAASADPAEAKSVLSQVETELKGMKDPMSGAQNWAQLAEAAGKAGETELADRAIDRGIADCETLYKDDANADDPNLAPKEYWPSLQSWRRVMVAAAAVRGLDAETLLTKVTDPDLLVMARLAVLRGVMKKPIRGVNYASSHRRER